MATTSRLAGSPAYGRRGAIAALALLAGACQPAAAPVHEAEVCTPPDVSMTLIASRNINRDDDGQPRPVQVRVYQLKTDSRLLSAPFDGLWKDDKTTLSDDLVKVDEFPVYPDTRSEAKFQADPAARFLAAVALFRTPLGRSWWTEFEMPVSTKGHCAASPVAFAVYIDQTRVAEGSDHLDEFPDMARVHSLQLRFDPASHPNAGAQDPAAQDGAHAP